MSDIWDTPEGKLGKEGEDLILYWRRSHNIYVTPMRDYSGKDDSRAPMMRTLRDSIILPDFDCCFKGETWWEESKAKTQNIHWRKTNTDYHGIETRQFLHYKQIKEISGKRVNLIIYEKFYDSDGYGRNLQKSNKYFFLRDFTSLEPEILGDGYMQKGKERIYMSNFRRDQFLEIHPV